MVLRNLHDLLSEQLRDLHDAACQYRDILPSMEIAATDDDLLAALGGISERQDDEIEQIEEACALLAVEPTGFASVAMRGHVREISAAIANFADACVIDATIIAHARRIVHHQIAGYGAARQFARVLGRNDVAAILDELASHATAHDQNLAQVSASGWFGGDAGRPAPVGAPDA